jgi:hypothetical protein
MFKEENKMEIVVHNPIQCRLIADEDFSPEDCERLLELDLRYLITLLTNPITNVGSLKIEAFKLGFKWIKEKDWITFTKDEIRVMKISIIGKWIQINPNLFSFEKNIQYKTYELLELIPENRFTVLLGNDPIKLIRLSALIANNPKTP